MSGEGMTGERRGNDEGTAIFPREFRTEALSSTAPMALGDRVTPHGSALVNCEAANQRAEAVVEFLLGRPRDRWACGSGGRVAVGRFENGSGQLCQRSDRNDNLVEEFTYGEADGLKFDLSYKPWRKPRGDDG